MDVDFDNVLGQHAHYLRLCTTDHCLTPVPERPAAARVVPAGVGRLLRAQAALVEAGGAEAA